MGCEIEFLPVGDGSKPGDAIVIRYGTPNAYELMVVDGGNLDSGKALVEHIRHHFGTNAVVSHVVLTHSDADHASGLRPVLSELTVRNLWLHVPWAVAAAARPYFANKSWTDDGLRKAILAEYNIIAELVTTAIDKKINIDFPFAGKRIGPFQVLAPYEDVYTLLVPQFDRTPEADQAAIEAEGFWIGKADVPSIWSQLIEKAAAKVQKWVKETWAYERLKDGGVTSASNESSVVLYGDFGAGERILLTGDAGVCALTLAAYQAERLGLPLQGFSFVQIPHHGSRRNVGPTILNRLLGPIQVEGSPARFEAFVSAPTNDDIHPRKMVLNAFCRRGGTVVATQGIKKIHWGGFPVRPGYSNAVPLPFSPDVEDYD